MRLFVAVDLAENVRRAVADVVHRAQPWAPGLRFAGEDKLHVTLAFLGNVDEDQLALVQAAMTGAAAAHGPLTLTVRGAGGFPSARKPRVLWLGLEGEVEKLAALKADLEERLTPVGYEPEKRTFKPHLTLARAKEARGDARLGVCADRLRGLDLGPSSVDEVILYQSQLSPKGARYTALVRAPLRGAPAEVPGSVTPH